MARTRQKLVEVKICDGCEKDDAHYECLRCSKAFCYDCMKIHGKEYPYAVGSGGSNEGEYCNECVAILERNGDDPLFNAYRRASKLRAKTTSFYEGISALDKANQARIKELRAEKGLK